MLETRGREAPPVWQPHAAHRCRGGRSCGTSVVRPSSDAARAYTVEDHFRRSFSPPSTHATLPLGCGVESSASHSPVIDRETLQAERLLLGMRLVVAATGTALLLFLGDHVSVPWIAYGLVAAGWVQGIAGLSSERALEHIVRRGMSRTTAVVDAALSLLWLYSTGGVESPWFVSLYVSIIWTSLRRPPGDV